MVPVKEPEAGVEAQAQRYEDPVLADTRRQGVKMRRRIDDRDRRTMNSRSTAR
jgi:hypothetical protein